MSPTVTVRSHLSQPEVTFVVAPKTFEDPSWHLLNALRPIVVLRHVLDTKGRPRKRPGCPSVSWLHTTKALQEEPKVLPVGTVLYVVHVPPVTLPLPSVRRLPTLVEVVVPVPPRVGTLDPTVTVVVSKDIELSLTTGFCTRTSSRDESYLVPWPRLTTSSRQDDAKNNVAFLVIDVYELWKGSVLGFFNSVAFLQWLADEVFSHTHQHIQKNWNDISVRLLFLDIMKEFYLGFLWN